MDFIELPNKITLKAVPHKIFHDNNALAAHNYCKIFELYNADNNFENIKSAVYYSNADDITRHEFDDGSKIIRSCDTGRGLYIEPDGTTYLTNPYYIWDDFLPKKLTNSKLKPEVIYAKGYTVYRTTYLTHICKQQNEN